MITSGVATAQTRKGLKLVEVFDAGQPQTIILKLYDDKADVLCYVLMPELAARKQVDSNWIYDANTIGSISCLKQLAATPVAEVKTATAVPQAPKGDMASPVNSSPAEVKPQAAPKKTVKSDDKAAATPAPSKRPAAAAKREEAQQLAACGEENTRKARHCRLKAKKKSH